MPMSHDVTWASFLEHFSVCRADAITSSSQLLVKALEKIGWLQELNVEVIPYPIDWIRWRNVRGVSSTPPIVLFLGRLEPRKAPEVVAKAIVILREEIQDAGALFVGKCSGCCDGLPYSEWVEMFAPGVSGCTYAEQVPRHELGDILSRARVLAMPSWFESYGIVALEAMAAGRPVVVTYTSGAAEFVERTGAGRTVPPGDHVALAESLRPFLSDPEYAHQVGELARAAVRQDLDPDKIAIQREIVYKRVSAAFAR